MEEEIVKDYVENLLGVETIALKYKIGKLKVKEIFARHNVKLRGKGGKQKSFTVPFKHDLTNKAIKCNGCGRVFSDVENKSGFLTNHMADCFPDVEIPNEKFRRRYKQTQGEDWYFKYYELVDKVEKPFIKCPECDWTTVDLKNQSGWFTTHVQENHGNIHEFMERHPAIAPIFT